MGRPLLAIPLFVLLSVSSAFGQYVDVIAACRRDVTTVCGAPSQPGGDQRINCVKLHFQDFTEPCQVALMRIARVPESCGKDIQEQCRGVTLKAGRTLLCVKGHFASLSESCKEAIGRAAVRKARTR